MLSHALAAAGGMEALAAAPAPVAADEPPLRALPPPLESLAYPALARAAHSQQSVAEAAAVLVIAAVEARTARRYGARAGRYVAFEAGAASQNLALQAAALGLGSVVVGAFDDAAVADAVRLAAGERPVALMPIGLPG